MDDTKKEEFRLVQELYIPAIIEHQKTGKVTQRHPKSGAILRVDRNDEVGYAVVSTDIDGILYRVKFKPKPK
ncbi:hypothetical protein [Roseobacter weihaiensis]|uniref:hypothetical protein n=1 Tax=Roseobacter weihaiensis TaxID=2763262 RepID=UPI001D0A829C|nr:hypothetical protein [Roseobacter sp. H9]